MAAVTQKIKSLTVSIFSPSICHEVMGPNAMILVFWMLSFKPAFSLYLFTLIKRLFSSSLLSIIRMVSHAYLRLLIFLPAILIQACASSSLAFLMMYFAYKLSKQGDSIQPNKDHGIWSHHFMANRWGNNGKSDRLYFRGLQDHYRWWLLPWY